jgi:nucleoside-diphosphate-sugar epimerase
METLVTGAAGFIGAAIAAALLDGAIAWSPWTTATTIIRFRYCTKV